MNFSIKRIKARSKFNIIFILKVKLFKFQTAASLVTATSITLSGSDVSPVTLNAEWSRLARLLLLAALSVCGCVGNVFMISAFMIEDRLKKTGMS